MALSSLNIYGCGGVTNHMRLVLLGTLSNRASQQQADHRLLAVVPSALCPSIDTVVVSTPEHLLPFVLPTAYIQNPV